MCVVAASRWPAVYFLPRGTADGYLQVQVQADEADPHVQRPQTRHLLPLQHWRCGQGPRLRLLGSHLARLALLPQRLVIASLATKSSISVMGGVFCLKHDLYRNKKSTIDQDQTVNFWVPASFKIVILDSTPRS